MSDLMFTFELIGIGVVIYFPIKWLCEHAAEWASDLNERQEQRRRQRFMDLRQRQLERFARDNKITD